MRSSNQPKCFKLILKRLLPALLSTIFMLNGLFFSAQSLGAETDTPPAELSQSLYLLSFQLGGIGVFQGKGYSGGGVIRYLPRFQWSPVWSAGISLSAGLLKYNNNSTFTALGAMGFIRRMVTPHWEAQMNAGVQTWTGSCQTSFVMGPTVSYLLGLNRQPWLKEIWFSYLPVFHTQIAHELGLGIGLQF